MSVTLTEIQDYIQTANRSIYDRIHGKATPFGSYEAPVAEEWRAILIQTDELIRNNRTVIGRLKFPDEDLTMLKENLDAIMNNQAQMNVRYMEAALTLNDVLLQMAYQSPEIEAAARNTAEKVANMTTRHARTMIQETLTDARQRINNAMSRENGHFHATPVTESSGNWLYNSTTVTSVTETFPQEDFAYYRAFCTLVESAERYFNQGLLEMEALRTAPGDLEQQEILGLCLKDIPDTDIDMAYSMKGKLRDATKVMAREIETIAKQWHRCLPETRAGKVAYETLMGQLQALGSEGPALT